VRLAEQISNEDRILLQAVSRVILSDAAGPLADQIKRRPSAEVPIAKLVPTRVREAQPTPAAPTRELVAFNGLGGFASDGREYVIVQREDQATPLPWCNVLANPRFGSVVSDSGSAYTWCDNAHEFRLTPWSNDPVED
jgi:cellobiose phosphorylase